MSARTEVTVRRGHIRARRTAMKQGAMSCPAAGAHDLKVILRRWLTRTAWSQMGNQGRQQQCAVTLSCCKRYFAMTEVTWTNRRSAAGPQPPEGSDPVPASLDWESWKAPRRSAPTRKTPITPVAWFLRFRHRCLWRYGLPHHEPALPRPELGQGARQASGLGGQRHVSQEHRQLIYAARGSKPAVTLTGMMASSSSAEIMPKVVTTLDRCRKPAA